MESRKSVQCISSLTRIACHKETGWTYNLPVKGGNEKLHRRADPSTSLYRLRLHCFSCSTFIEPLRHDKCQRFKKAKDVVLSSMKPVKENEPDKQTWGSLIGAANSTVFQRGICDIDTEKHRWGRESSGLGKYRLVGKWRGPAHPNGLGHHQWAHWIPCERDFSLKIIRSP